MIRPGIQATFPVETLRKYGCHFFSLLKYFEEAHQVELTTDEIISIFNETSVLVTYIDWRGVERPVIDIHGADVYDAVVFMNYLCKRYEKIFRYSKYIRDLKDRPDVRLCIHRLVRPNGTHFLFDKDGEIFDPMPPDRPAAATWTLDSYRILS